MTKQANSNAKSPPSEIQSLEVQVLNTPPKKAATISTSPTPVPGPTARLLPASSKA